jgi:cell fate regulator YaaT (PSP1 superfamily)
MPQTVEVRFKGIRRDFFLWPDDREPLRPREAVVVQAERGQDLGHVATTDATAEKKCGGCTGCSTVGGADDSAARRLGDSAVEESLEDTSSPRAPTDDRAAEPPSRPAAEPAAEPTSRRAAEPAAEPPSRPAANLRPVLRRASPDEIRTAEALRRSEEDARRQAIEKARQHRLDMKVSDAEWQWDRGKLTLYFTAEKRVDFRALVRDLAAAFRTRIELRQIGVRDEAARLSGVGRCGREYCCSSWLKELSPVSLALAKDQHLSLNPAQISGGCGRLLCCLKYEHEFYVAARKRFPREGKTVTTSRGVEKVIAVDIFRERVFLRNEEGSRIIPLVQLREEEMAAPNDGSAARRLGGSAESAPPPTSTAKPPAAEPSSRRAAEPSLEPPSRRAAEPPPEPPSRPAAEPPKKRRRRRGRRGRGPQGGPSSPPGPPEA